MSVEKDSKELGMPKKQILSQLKVFALEADGMPVPSIKTETRIGRYMDGAEDQLYGGAWLAEDRFAVRKGSWLKKEDLSEDYRVEEYICPKKSLFYMNPDSVLGSYDDYPRYEQLQHLSGYCFLENCMLYILDGTLYCLLESGLIFLILDLKEHGVADDILEMEMDETADKLYIHFMTGYEKIVSNEKYQYEFPPGIKHKGWQDVYTITRKKRAFNNINKYVKYVLDGLLQAAQNHAEKGTDEDCAFVYCMKCGRQLPGRAKFCSACGTRIER